MNMLAFILAGLAGTFAMSAFTTMVFKLLRRPYRVITILAAMMQFKPIQFDHLDTLSKQVPRGILVCAVVLHYSIGIIFTYAYCVVISRGWFSLSLAGAILFGAVIGTIGVIGWLVFFKLHPSPPGISLRHYLSTIWMGHVVLAVVAYYVMLI